MFRPTHQREKLAVRLSTVSLHLFKKEIKREMESEEIILTGGNMNKPVLRNNTVYKEIHSASHNIHELLYFVRNNGIDWVPRSFGFVDNKHAFSFLSGIVIHDNPNWLFRKRILKESAEKLREWHDATVGFQQINNNWLLSNDEPYEVICHNDFAPYNWVFNNQKQLFGLIDFDTCSPGSRLWDIAYTTYRIVPLMPDNDVSTYFTTSPFHYEKMIKRLRIFIKEYSKGKPSIKYSIDEVIEKVHKRLYAIADWSENEGKCSHNQELLEHAKMYRLHADWLQERSLI